MPLLTCIEKCSCGIVKAIVKQMSSGVLTIIKCFGDFCRHIIRT